MKKLIVVTSGTKGIGRAVIRLFAEHGFDVATCARTEKDLKKLKKEIEAEYESEVFYHPTDMSVQSEVNTFISYLKTLDRPVDVLVNNTGFFTPGGVLDEDFSNLSKMMDTNVYSAFHMSQAIGKEMRRRKKGYIFNVCSIASIVAYANGGSYAITKHAMLGMSRVLREELKEHNVRVSSVMPGATLTASWEGVDLPEERFMKAEDVAEAIFSAYTMSPRSVVEEIIIRPQLGDI
ncbi:SDR family oxidoreductase [Roseivirga sp. BDSF3-8]|uniref:SDR family oxidoreductase n=1 Tax=Roseivirga sp. BDSF3-8 TaxID=3241598 RepID=UPI0035320304